MIPHNKIPKRHLEKIISLKREEAHPLLHKIHKKHKISKKTLFYIKEYGPHTNALRTIIKESIKVLILASLISSFGGMALEKIKMIFVSIIPLVIMLPVLNDSLGDYGTIISSRLSTMLHEGKISSKVFKNKELKKLFMQIIVVALITALLSSIASLFISSLSGYPVESGIVLKILALIFIDIMLIVTILFIISIKAGLYFFRKKEDPNNFLIPLTTSIADFGNMFILFILVRLFFG
jgi:mgtE-like transporter